MSSACAGKRCCSGSNRLADDAFRASDPPSGGRDARGAMPHGRTMNLGVYFHSEIHVTSKGSVATQRSRTCIIFSVGRKSMHAVTMDGSIGCIEIAKDRHLEPLMLNGKPYPIERAAALYLGSALTKTEVAVKVLTKLLNGLPIDQEALLVCMKR